jgi:hypothetical protein
VTNSAHETNMDYTRARVHAHRVQLRLLTMRSLQNTQCKLKRTIGLSFAEEDNGGEFLYMRGSRRAAREEAASK